MTSLVCAGLLVSAAAEPCTLIAIGKKATRDGSVIVSQTDSGPNSRIHLVRGRKHEAGAQAPVYWGLQDPKYPIERPGEVIGRIPQAAETYNYYHSAYSALNEHQLGIGESTITQKPELVLKKGEGEQIMTIEQAQVFALERQRKAREAVEFIGKLVETYGFLPSTGDGAEALVIADTEEAWVFEVFSVGKGWKRSSGRPGAVWAAQRVPDDAAVVIPNWSIIKEIDAKDRGNFRVSPNYRQEAIDRGWYDPKSGKPFIWQEAYAPLPQEYATGRFWLFGATFATKAGNWPDRKVDPKDPYKTINDYTQTVEPLSLYPFAWKLDRQLCVEDIIAFQRSWMENTIYDMSAQPAWLVPDGKGGVERSPLATPFPNKALRALLKLNNRRPVARHRGHYGMVTQLRGWLPREIGGVYWVYLDNPAISAYVPMYAGATDTAEAYKIYDEEAYSEQSARWLIDFVDNLANTRFQEAIQDVRNARDPFEKRLFARQASLEQEALELYRKDPEAARRMLTDYSVKAQGEVPPLYLKLRNQLITKYTNNRE
jgi:dipeptidase